MPTARLALIGNSLPRRCGIATFTTDLDHALSGLRPRPETCIVAMTDYRHTYEYPPTVGFQIHDDRLDDYVRAADFLNAGGYEVVSLQHEFGIYGGGAGSHILALLSRLTMPVVTTLHTVLAQPTAMQRGVFDRVLAASARVVVMAEKGRALLRTEYGVPAGRIDLIPHGIPDLPFAEPETAKAALGFAGSTVILTFGLLSPNKGIEVMLDAMPLILRRCPDAVYVVLGATHPNLVRQHGEAYREKLVARAQDLGIADHVVFLDRFVEKAELFEFIAMCDVYVTPYLNEAQMTSGTLAYSFGLGKAVVSTPYWHACELLADGRGILVPFGVSAVIGDEIAALLTDENRRLAMRRRAYSSSRSMIWPRTAERYMATYDRARREQAAAGPAAAGWHRGSAEEHAPPDVRTEHFFAMCDDTGLFQHAVHSVPDRLHGYCIDDNARALLVACALFTAGERRLPEALTTRFAAFLQHAWNPDNRRFRNFMSFQRHWVEDSGSDDSQGRTFWALGVCAQSDISPSRRRWAAGLFAEALPDADRLRSPRAWAFTLLGLEAYRAAHPTDKRAIDVQWGLTERLLALLTSVETPDWVWFEDVLAYDNPRLSQALIVTGAALGHVECQAAGLRTLRWLMTRQTTAQGVFRPVGTASFGVPRTHPESFDQQPLEATAAISACLAAWRADGDVTWTRDAARAFAWFHGRNDLAASLVDPETGSCRDGLHPDRTNENRGGESVVSYLLSALEIRQLARVSETATSAAAPIALRA